MLQVARGFGPERIKIATDLSAVEEPCSEELWRWIRPDLIGTYLYLGGVCRHSVNTFSNDVEGLRMSRTFSGQVALVTGAAAGIGRATAQAFAAEGCCRRCIFDPGADAMLTQPCSLKSEIQQRVRRSKLGAMKFRHMGQKCIGSNISGSFRGKTALPTQTECPSLCGLAMAMPCLTRFLHTKLSLIAELHPQASTVLECLPPGTLFEAKAGALGCQLFAGVIHAQAEDRHRWR